MVGNVRHRKGKSQKDEVHVIVNVDLQCNNKINTKLRGEGRHGSPRKYSNNETLPPNVP